mmetsp:Transcript_5773/g.14936  ORF Transcript_5773/g.14936 Transcript_5773/m.14936 type:complete len:130 (+) Transcript_5773:2680-3069(+)
MPQKKTRFVPFPFVLLLLPEIKVRYNGWFYFFLLFLPFFFPPLDDCCAFAAAGFLALALGLAAGAAVGGVWMGSTCASATGCWGFGVSGCVGLVGTWPRRTGTAAAALGGMKPKYFLTAWFFSARVCVV